MNISQKTVLLLFSIFLLIASIGSFNANKATPGIFALAFSAIGFFFLFAGKGAMDVNIKKRLKKWFKITGIIVILLLVLLMVFLGISNTISRKKMQLNMKCIELTKYSIAKKPDRPISYDGDYAIQATILNKGNFVIKGIDVAVEYYTPDGYYISSNYVSDFTDNAIITPNTKTTVNKSAYLYLPNQQFVTKLTIKKLRIR